MNVPTRLALAAVVLVGVGLAAAVPAGAATSAQNKFVKDVRFLDPNAATASNKAIIKLGNGVCKDLKSGTSVKALAKILKGSEKAVFVSATTDLCSKYKAKVTTYYASTTTTTPPGPTLTQQQKSAVAEAKQYLSTEAFSQQGLIDQLDSSAGSGYSVNDATVAVNSLTVDWNAEAVQAAKEYLQNWPFSCSDLIQQLDSSAGSQFTVAQATYGATQAGDC
jgi:hypothetical protein